MGERRRDGTGECATRALHRVPRVEADGPGRRRKRAGFTMLELVVAIGVLMVATLAGFGTQVRSYELIDSSRSRTVAMTDLEVCMEQLLTRTADAIPGEFPEGIAVAPFNALHLTDQRVVPAYPNYLGAGPVPDPLDIVLTSTWTDSRGRPQSLTLSTIKSR